MIENKKQKIGRNKRNLFTKKQRKRKGNKE